VWPLIDRLVLDIIAERTFTRSEFIAQLDGSADADGDELHRH
jgi:hypothetical protein